MNYDEFEIESYNQDSIFLKSDVFDEQCRIEKLAYKELFKYVYKYKARKLPFTKQSKNYIELCVFTRTANRKRRCIRFR